MNVHGAYENGTAVKEEKTNEIMKSTSKQQKITMPGLIIGKFVQWSPLIQVLLIAAGIFVSFLISLNTGDVSVYLPFISETGAYSPAMCIFSLTLILGSFLGCIMIIFRFLMLRQSPLNEERKFSKFNYGSFIVGMISMLGLAGVAAFPMTTVFWAHLTTASVYFIGSNLYFASSAIITYKVSGRSKLFILRGVLSGLMAFFLLILVVCFPMALKRWHEINSFIPALKEPENEGFTLVFISSILEWSIAGVILVYTLSLLKEFKEFNLYITATSKDNGDNNSVAEDPPRALEEISA